jgi:phosphoglycerate dehydrogenase-like enzyme
MNPLTLLVLAKPTLQCLRLLESLPDTTRIVVAETPEALAAAAPEADAFLYIMQPRDRVKAVWDMAPKLRWVHSFVAGVDHTLFPELVESPVPLTNGRGVFAAPLGDFTVFGILFFEKAVRYFLAAQAEAKWAPRTVGDVQGKVLGIVGYGGIGRAAAVRAKAFGIQIHALSRHPERTQADPLVDRSYGPGELDALIAASDYLLTAAPLTPETRGMIGPAQLALLKPEAIVINVGRGPVIDEAALIDALQNNRIRGAALDVFNVEPLPADSPFYKMDNLYLSPHCADHIPSWQDDAAQLFVDNFLRFAKGEPLQNIVDKRAGY